MLNRVSFPLTAAQIGDFILSKDYTNFLTLQQVFGELTDADMITTQAIRNRTHLAITKEGRETLQYFENRISDAIKNEIHEYLHQNEFTLRNEVSVIGDYYKSTSGDYEARLIAKDRGLNLVDITLSVPTQEMASTICDNWQKKNQTVYKYLIEQLF